MAMSKPNDTDFMSDDTFRCHVKLSTRWRDEDNQNVLNNAVYMTLIEEARLYYFLQLKLLPPSLRLPFTLLNTNIRFINPGRGGTEVVVDIKTIKLGGSSFVQRYRIRDAMSSQVWCRAEAVMVCWDVDKKKKRPMPLEFREAVSLFEDLKQPAAL